jgi:polysaccharide pyruvyl transferase WcaK-like protein
MMIIARAMAATAGPYSARPCTHRARDRQTVNERSAASPKVGFFGLLGSGNSGNDASMETVLSYLRAEHPDVVVDVMGSGASERIRARYGLDNMPLYWFTRHEERASGLSAITLKALGKGLDVFRTASWIRRHDVVIVPGTGPLETTMPVQPWGFPFTLFVATLAGRLFGAKVALVSVGASDIKKPATRWLSDAAARLAYYRSYRDDYSRAAMQRRGIDTSKDYIFPDLVFGVPMPAYDPGDMKVIGVGVMDYYGGDDDRPRAAEIHSSYVEKMTAFVSWLVSSGYKVRIFGGDSKFDWDIADQVISDVRREQPDLDPTALTAERVNSYTELVQLIASVGIVVATRYHNVMCALKLCKPTISIGYSGKFVTLMTEMGVAEFNQFADSFSVSQLIDQFEEVKRRHAELRSRMADRNAVNREALDEQFALLSEKLLGIPRVAPTRARA